MTDSCAARRTAPAATYPESEKRSETYRHRPCSVQLTGHGDLAPRREVDGGVEHAVLLGARELLAVQDEDARRRRGWLARSSAHRAARVDLGDDERSRARAPRPSVISGGASSNSANTGMSVSPASLTGSPRRTAPSSLEMVETMSEPPFVAPRRFSDTRACEEGLTFEGIRPHRAKASAPARGSRPMGTTAPWQPEGNGYLCPLTRESERRQ